MSIELALTMVFIILTLTIIAVFVLRRLPKKLKSDVYAAKWKELQNYCRDKSEWSLALAEADALLASALKKRKFKGKSMGERMVSAQRVFTNNDNVWFAHNLHKKVVADPSVKLREADIKAALMGFRQALRDLGALRDGQSKDS